MRQYGHEGQRRVLTPRPEQAHKPNHISWTTDPIGQTRLDSTVEVRGPDDKARANLNQKIYQRVLHETEQHGCRATELRVAAFANRKQTTKLRDSTLSSERRRDERHRELLSPAIHTL